jgi:hypothetical protein
MPILVSGGEAPDSHRIECLVGPMAGVDAIPLSGLEARHVRSLARSFDTVRINPFRSYVKPRPTV